MMSNSSNIFYPPGYNRQVVVCPGNASTESGETMIDIPVPSDWNGTNMTVEVYYSASDTGQINMAALVNSYDTSDVNYNSYGADGCHYASTAYTLYSFSQSVNVGGFFTAGDKLMTIKFYRYDAQHVGQPCQDYNPGDVYVHGVRLTYNVDL